MKRVDASGGRIKLAGSSYEGSMARHIECHADLKCTLSKQMKVGSVVAHVWSLSDRGHGYRCGIATVNRTTRVKTTKPRAD